MFISRAEKEFFHSTIATLQTRVMNLEGAIGRLASETYLNRPGLVANERAPWGIKKDGSPRKRPGRPRLVMKVGAK
jgi:hypothetical protein